MANIDFQYQLTPKGQELAREVSNETVKTTKKMMQKFDGDTINNFINGKSKSPQNKEYASSKTKNVKSKNNTASKIKPLPQGAEMIDMLNKIHTFLQRNGEQDKLHQDRLNNYMEENLAEAKARHDKLLEAIKKLTKDVNKATYFPVFEFLSFEKSKNKEPITGSKINDDRIGKFISLKLKKLKSVIVAESGKE